MGYRANPALVKTKKVVEPCFRTSTNPSFNSKRDILYMFVQFFAMYALVVMLHLQSFFSSVN